MICALVCRGHVLLEDVPGTAKTVLARAIAQSIDGRARVAHPVHPRPAADRRHRPVGLQPEGARVRVPAGPAVREHRARRRDQPRDAANAVGAARGDGRGPDHRRRRVAPAARPVPDPRDAEPARPRGDVPAARGPARPLLPPGRRSAIRASTTSCASCRSSGTRTRSARFAPVIDVDELRRSRLRSRTSTSTRSSSSWLIELVRATRDARVRPNVGASVRGSLALERAVAGVGAHARTVVRRPDDVEALFEPVLAHRVLLNPYRLDVRERRRAGRRRPRAPLPRARAAAGHRALARRARFGRDFPLLSRRRGVGLVGRDAQKRAPRRRLRDRQLAPVPAAATAGARSTGRRPRGCRARATRTSSSSANTSPRTGPHVVLVVDRRPAMSLYPRELPWLHKPAAVAAAGRMIVDSALAASGLPGYLDVADPRAPRWLRRSGEQNAARIRDRELAASTYTAPADNLTRALPVPRARAPRRACRLVRVRALGLPGAAALSTSGAWPRARSAGTSCP